METLMNNDYSKLKNVFMTPHIGSYSKEIRLKMEQEALDAIFKIIR